MIHGVVERDAVARPRAQMHKRCHYQGHVVSARPGVTCHDGVLP